MNKVKDGGPAFPQTYRISGCSTQVDAVGLTMRDWFAGQALKAIMISNPDADCGLEGYVHDAFLYADAMIAERAKGTS